MSKFSRNPCPTREKSFGEAHGFALDRNAKARIMAFAKGYNAKNRQPGQHRGPLTRAIFEVLETLLFAFHNSKDGRCFPSYESIAERAQCCRDTVYEAIKALEAANVLTWVNRFTKIRVPERDIFGRLAHRWQVIRTSNAYLFRDPLPCANRPENYKSENPPGTLNPESISKDTPPRIIVLDPKNTLDAALIGLGRTMGALAAR